MWEGWAESRALWEGWEESRAVWEGWAPCNPGGSTLPGLKVVVGLGGRGLGLKGHPLASAGDPFPVSS